MYHNILVPLDGSKMAESILDHVEDLARQDQAQVILLQVEDTPVMLGRDEVIDTATYKKTLQKRQQRVKSYLANLMEKLQESGIDAHYKIGYGSVTKTIAETAAEEKADLVAMATDGFDGLSRSVFGSVAAGLVQKVHCPMLITRRKGTDRSAQR
jgi:nucleotide-binding universal stress UspA family protein